MKIILALLLFSFTLPVLAFRGGGGFGGGGGFRGGGMSVGTGAYVGSGSVGTGANVGSGSVGTGANVGTGAVGSRDNVNVGVGASGAHGTVYAHRSAAISVHYHAYSPTYWGWYGYAPYHYYYPTTQYAQVEVKDAKPAEVGTVVADIPSECKAETINQINYKHCGVNWFEPKFSGTEIEYVAVEPPAK